jgi:hypothetical protein
MNIPDSLEIMNIPDSLEIMSIPDSQRFLATAMSHYLKEAVVILFLFLLTTLTDTRAVAWSM